MMELFAELAALAAVVWAATEGLGRLFSWGKKRLALVLGPLSGVVAYGTGLLHLNHADGPWGWVGAGFFGLLSTLAAAVGHDKLIQPLLGEKKTP